MNKLENLLDIVKSNEVKIAYAVYKVFIEKPDYLDDFEDEFEDDYEDGFDEEDDFEDEEE